MSSYFQDTRRGFFKTTAAVGVGYWVAGRASAAAAAPAAAPADETKLRVGVAEVDITPPLGFPMAGYYHERLAEGTINPLKAKAIVFRTEETAAALVVCDLIGIATDLKLAIRQRASDKTGIPPSNIAISATHSHTAPDYTKELYLTLGGVRQDPSRAKYIEKLIAGIAQAIIQADAEARPAKIETGSAIQETPVSFNRRFVMRDGSVKTWQSYENPNVVRAAGPIDPQIGLVAIREESGEPRAILSNFALHLDTVGGMKWSRGLSLFHRADAPQGRRPERDFDFRQRLLRRHQSHQPASERAKQVGLHRQRDRRIDRSPTRQADSAGQARFGGEVRRRTAPLAGRDEGRSRRIARDSRRRATQGKSRHVGPGRRLQESDPRPAPA